MKTLVFVHGFLGGSKIWNDQVAAFSKQFNVVTPELPGFGTAWDQHCPDRIEAFAEHILGHLDEAGIDEFMLVGHSMGGMIVQEMAARAPKRINRLVLYGTGPVGMLPGRFEPIEESRRRVREEGPEATVRRTVTTWFMQGVDASKFGLCMELGSKASVQAVLAGLSAMEAWDGRAALPGISQPTLVLWGDSDRSYLWSQPEALWQGITGAELAVVPGCAHNVHLEKPFIFNALLDDFLCR